MSKLEEALQFQIDVINLPLPEREYRFAAIHTGGIGKGSRARIKEAGLKDWRFDFAWPHLKIAVEVEGGLHVNGRHNRGKGFEDDLVKYDKAMRLGWDIYRCGASLIKSGEAIKTIEGLIKLKAEKMTKSERKRVNAAVYA